MGFSRHSFQSFGTLETSHARSSSRNDNSSVVKFRSMKKTPSRCRSRTPLPFFPNLNQLSANQAGSAAAPRRGKIRANRIPVLPIFLAKVFLENFSSAGLGQACHEVEGTRTLVMGEVRTAELDEFGLRGSGIRL